MVMIVSGDIYKYAAGLHFGVGFVGVAFVICAGWLNLVAAVAGANA